MAVINGKNVVLSANITGLVDIDNEYNPESENPISGKGVAQALAGFTGGGINSTAINLLIEILQTAIYNANVLGKIEALQEALASGNGDESGGDNSGGSDTPTEPDTPDEPDTPTEEPDEVIINKINTEICAIDPTTGNVVENSSRVTTDFIEVNGGQDCTVVSNNGYYIRIFAYTSDKVLDTNITYRGMFNASSSTETLPETTKYIRILMKKSTEADFDETELNTISVFVNDVIYVNDNHSIETPNLSYEIGAINNGVEENSSVRARTDFIKLEDECVNFNLPNNYFILRVYDVDKNYIRDIVTGNITEPWYFENGTFTIEDGYYVRLVICPDVHTNPQITQGALDNMLLVANYANIGKQILYKLQGV
jgi:hypothetical protein